MTEIASSDEASKPVLDWEKDEQKLHITDPFFAFFLKWGMREAQQDPAPNSRPPQQLPASPDIQTSDSQRTPPPAAVGELIVGQADSSMTNTKFCLLSLLLVVLALGVHGGALRDWSRDAGTRARAVSATLEQRAVMRAEADRLSHRGSVL